MTILNRFGRRLPIPSTRQIRHELVTFAAREDARLKDLKAREADALVPAPAAIVDGEPLV